MADACFRVNTPAVVYERFDDELVAINMNTGVYHSMIGSGADAFVLLAQQATAQELADALAVKYAAQPADIRAALDPFLENLEKEQLITPVGTRTERGTLELDQNPTREPFVAPKLEAFKDLEGLLLLDPIHEVGDEGWPLPQDPLAK